MFFEAKVDIVSHIQIYKTVVIIICKRASEAPACVSDTGTLCCICEGTIAVVAIEHISLKIRHVQIQTAVVIIVADSAAAAVTRVSNTRRFSNIGKCAISIVAVQFVGRWCH